VSAESPDGGATRGTKLVALLWLVLVVALLWMPPPEVPKVRLPGFDLLVHFVLFMGLGLLWSRSGLGPITVLIGAGLLALVTELAQGFLPWPRTPSGLDAAADVLGALVGVVVWHRVRGRRRAGQSGG
jgi:VanZ family protein